MVHSYLKVIHVAVLELTHNQILEVSRGVHLVGEIVVICIQCVVLIFRWASTIISIFQVAYIMVCIQTGGHSSIHFIMIYPSTHNFIASVTVAHFKA